DLTTGLIEAFTFNLEQGNGPLNAFEMGHVFTASTDAGGTSSVEKESVGGILGGDASQGQWVNGGKPQPMGWYEAKGILEAVFRQLGLAVDYRPAVAEGLDERLHPGRTAALWVRGRTALGTFGQLHPRLRQSAGLPEAVYVFELDWPVLVTCLAGQQRQVTSFKAYSSYPASDRDLAFFAPTDIAVTDLAKAITRAGGKLLDEVTLFDEYRGETVPEGQRSLAFRLVYRSSDRTLTDQDIDPVHQKVRAALEKNFKVSLRS
ncbi:MAG: phenylalanine--tRNA ligase subunit beta, partial [Cyanobacteria bacterium P01_A01_bin.105]